MAKILTKDVINFAVERKQISENDIRLLVNRTNNGEEDVELLNGSFKHNTVLVSMVQRRKGIVFLYQMCFTAKGGNKPKNCEFSDSQRIFIKECMETNNFEFAFRGVYKDEFRYYPVYELTSGNKSIMYYTRLTPNNRMVFLETNI